MGQHPNTITIQGFVLNVGAAIILAFGHLTWGGAVLLLTSAVDGLDGALARVSGKMTRFGAFLDSTLDRISEGALFLGLVAWLLSQQRPVDVYLVFVTLLGSVMVSYIRARAEGVGYACKVGALSRLERVLVLGVGLMLGWVQLTLGLLAALTWFTVVQRMVYVYRESRRNP